MNTQITRELGSGGFERNLLCGISDSRAEGQRLRESEPS